MLCSIEDGLPGAGQLICQRVLDVSHRLLRARVGKPLREVSRGNVLEPLVNPPQVTLGIAHSGHPLTKSQLGWLGDKSSTSPYRTVHGLLEIGDVDAQMRGYGRPLRASIKHHDHSTTDLYLDVANAPIGSEHP